MKSEAEIKRYIDSRKVLTKNELGRFIYGYKNNTVLTEKWWIYVLQTKDLKELYNEKQRRIKYENKKHNKSHKDKQRILELLKKDIRLKNAGTRKQTEYLLRFYNIKVSRRTLMKWRQLETPNE